MSTKSDIACICEPEHPDEMTSCDLAMLGTACLELDIRKAHLILIPIKYVLFTNVAPSERRSVASINSHIVTLYK